MDYYCPYAPGGICESYEPDLCDFCPYEEDAQKDLYDLMEQIKDLKGLRRMEDDDE